MFQLLKFLLQTLSPNYSQATGLYTPGDMTTKEQEFLDLEVSSFPQSDQLQIKLCLIFESALFQSVKIMCVSLTLRVDYSHGELKFWEKQGLKN